jgi:hypothetical protein
MFRSSVAAFYALFKQLFYSFTGTVRPDGFLIFLPPYLIRSEVEKIVYWVSEVLFAAEIAFRGLNGCMPQQELNLLQFTTAIMAQLRAGPPKIVWSNVL